MSSDPLASDKPRRLGRGLEALLGNKGGSPPHPASLLGASPAELPVSAIRPNPYQPRRIFSPEDLAELEASLRTNGLLQPVTVRQVHDHYELVAGERRLRAASRLGWQTIPALVRQLGEREMLTLALIENLQRTDLNAMEEADGLFRLLEEFGLTQQQVAEAVGKDRSTVANLLRIRQLPDDVRELVRSGALSAGHARALLSLPSDVSVSEVARDITVRHLSVRAIEQLSRKKRPEPLLRPASQNPPTGTTATAETRRVIDRLRRYLQTDVSLTANNKSEGELRIRFYSAEDLDRLLELITHQPNE